MESFEVDRSLYDIGENDLKEIWESDFDSQMQDSFGAESDWNMLLDHQPVILNDRMMTDAIQSPHITSEHSYSLVTNDELPDSPLDGSRLGLEHDLESECFPAIPMATATGGHNEIFIKQEPISAPNSPQMASTASHKVLIPSSSSSSSSSSSTTSTTPSTTTHSQSLLKQPTIILATRPSSQRCLLVPKVNIKVEPMSSGFSLPPTPPSSTSSDSEGSLSPLHSQQPSSPPTISSPSGMNSSSCRRPNSLGSLGTRSNTSTPLISSQPKGATGVLILTEEEKRTLLAEGYPIPSRLPLTKTEEKSLKKIRRKIKNKISAQESRRKKKEYMDALEKKVEALNSENLDYKKKLDSLESSNKSLLCQLQKLQALLGDIPNRISRNMSTQTTSLMVVVLCFTLAFGTWGTLSINSLSSSNSQQPFQLSLPKPLPSKLRFLHKDSYSTPSRQSRFLLALLDEKEFEEDLSETCKELPLVNSDKNSRAVAPSTPPSYIVKSIDDQMWDYTVNEEIAKITDVSFLESFKSSASLHRADDATVVANFSANNSTVVNASVKPYMSTTA